MSITPFQDPFGSVSGAPPPTTTVLPGSGAPTGGAPAQQQPLPDSGGANPFSDVLQHVATWNNALQPQTAPQQNAFAASGDTIDNPDPTGGGGGGGGSTDPTAGGKGRITGLPPTMPPGTDPSVWNDVVRYAGSARSGGGNWDALYQHPEWIAEFRNWALQRNLGSTVRIEDYLEAKHPELRGLTGQSGRNTYDATMQDADRYAQAAQSAGQNYSFLYQHPEMISDFRNWVGQDPKRAGVDIVDYWAHRYPTLPHGLAGRSGADTYAAYAATLVGGGTGGGGYGGGGTGGGGGAGGGAVPPVDPGAPPAEPPPGERPPGLPNEPNPGVIPPPAGEEPPPGQRPPGLPNEPNPGVIPPTPPGLTDQLPPDEIQHLIDIFNKNFGGANDPDIEKMLNPMFGRQRQLLAQQLESAAALTPGRLQSGGFGQNEGQALSDLSGQQSAQLGGALERQAEAKRQQNTQLMQLATTAGMQKYMTDVNADLERYKVVTNADLARWLDDKDNILKKYGIDTNDVLERYKAQTQLEGEKYVADKNVMAARLHAALGNAGANAAMQAAQINAQLQREMGYAGLQVDREKNIGQFILGLLNLGNLDISQINQILTGLPAGTVAVKP